MRFILNIALVVFFNIVFSQDLRFSQFDLNPLYLNPAYTGMSNDLRVGLNYRNHWINVPGKTIPGPLSSYNLSIDKRFGNVLVGGLGGFLHQSYKGEGFYKHTMSGFSYSWQMPLQTSDLQVLFGVMPSFNQLTIDWSRLIFSDQISADEGFLNTPSSFIPQIDGNRYYFDMNSGFLLKANLGRKISTEFSYSLNHLPRPNISLNNLEERLPRKNSIFFSSSFKVGNNFYVNPKILVEVQSPFMAYTTGFNIYVLNRYFHQNQEFYAKPLYVGFYFQSTKFRDFLNTNSVIFNVGHSGNFGQSKNIYQVGLSYDFNVLGLNMSTFGSVEASFNLIFDTRTNKRNNNKRFRDCSQFKGNPLSPLN